MSEVRVPDITLVIRLPRKHGKKSLKIRLYLAEQFRHSWTPDRADAFTPRVPLKSSDREEYWGKDIYRVMVEGQWMFPGEYRFVELDTIVELIKKEKP